MTKQELERHFEKHGTFLSISEISRILGMKRETVSKAFLSDLEYIQMGRSKRYFFKDVAGAVFQSRER